MKLNLSSIENNDDFYDSYASYNYNDNNIEHFESDLKHFKDLDLSDLTKQSILDMPTDAKNNLSKTIMVFQADNYYDGSPLIIGGNFWKIARYPFTGLHDTEFEVIEFDLEESTNKFNVITETNGDLKIIDQNKNEGLMFLKNNLYGVKQYEFKSGLKLYDGKSIFIDYNKHKWYVDEMPDLQTEMNVTKFQLIEIKNIGSANESRHIQTATFLDDGSLNVEYYPEYESEEEIVLPIIYKLENLLNNAKLPSAPGSILIAYPLEYLSSNQILISPNRRYITTLDNKGNLRVFDGQSGTEPIWSSGELSNESEYHLLVQNDKNLVIYNKVESYSADDSVWASGTFRENGKGNFLLMQNDGNLVLYDSFENEIWSSKNGVNEDYIPTIPSEEDNLVIKPIPTVIEEENIKLYEYPVEEDVIETPKAEVISNTTQSINGTVKKITSTKDVDNTTIKTNISSNSNQNSKSQGGGISHNLIVIILLIILLFSFFRRNKFI